MFPCAIDSSRQTLLYHIREIHILSTCSIRPIRITNIVVFARRGERVKKGIIELMEYLDINKDCIEYVLSMMHSFSLVWIFFSQIENE